MKLEVIAFNIDCCVEIEKAGAHRVELCANPHEGGTTPSAGFILAARKKLSIELFPIIRPRGGDFVYSNEEYNVIKEDILFCKQAGCDGVVTGFLTPNGEVNTSRISEVVDLAHPMQVTFHRAFDRSREPFDALEQIIKSGCTRILTSGLRPTAIEGIDLLKELVRQAKGRIIIMPGSGIRSSNIRDIAIKTEATEFHSSARQTSSTNMIYRNGHLLDEQGHAVVDIAEVEKMVEKIDKL